MERSQRPEKNRITVSGIVTDCYYSHTFNNQDFFTILLSVCREEDCDEFKVIMPQSHTDRNLKSIDRGMVVRVTGFIRTRSIESIKDNKSSHLDVFIYGTSISVLTDEEYYINGNDNTVVIEGTFCREMYCHSINKSAVSAGMVACNRKGNTRADYIPIVAAGNFSSIIKRKSVGDRIQCSGRLQTRKIVCKYKIKIVYEVVISGLLEEVS